MNYTETVYRYQIFSHDDLPEEHKEAYRRDGIDPDDIWSLAMSYKTFDAAKRSLMVLVKDAPRWRTYMMIDGGAEKAIERPVY